MKTLLFALVILACALPSYGQGVGNTVMKHYPGVPSGGCSQNQLATDDANGNLYNCKSGAWNAVGGGGGSISGLTTGQIPVAGSPTSLTSSIALNGSGGPILRQTSPSLVTPALGTPTSGVMTNVTGLPLTTGVTGLLPRANGGLNSSSAGTGLLRDGTTPAASELSGDVATSGSNAVTVNKIHGGTYPTSAGLMGSNGSAQPVAVSATTATAYLNQATSSLQGLVPATGGGTANFYRADNTFSPACQSAVVTAPCQLANTFTALTPGSTITWATASASPRASVSLGVNSTLNVTGMTSGVAYTMLVISGGYTLAQGTGCTWTTPWVLPGSATGDLIGWVYDGTYCQVIPPVTSIIGTLYQTGVSTANSGMSQTIVASVPSTGMYQINMYWDQNAGCTTVGSGAFTSTVYWTDATGVTRSQNWFAGVPSTTSGASNYNTNAVQAWLGASTAITVTNTYAPCMTGTWTYDNHYAVQKIQ